ncbi:MAG TPA: AzlC family ABC transporter permease [Ktedonobacteraceae bacterium]|nr:AzlC family ABC transporter permease [Ktedonobacteraceae bacterium]
MVSKRSEFLTGIKEILPILLGVLPFGLIYGVSARSAGLPVLAAQAMSFIVFAGSAQFVTVQLISAGVPVSIVILTACLLNLRHALYSASIAPYVKRLPRRWKMLLAYVLTDEAYAVTITHYRQSDGAGIRSVASNNDARFVTPKHWYFLGAGLTLWIVWQISTAVGILLGANVPTSWSLDFTLPLTFIALVVPALKTRAEWIAAGTAGIIAVLAVGLPLNLGLLVATFTGMAIGLGVEVKAGGR